MKSDRSSIRTIRWPLILAGLTAVTGICLSFYLRGRIAQTEAETAKLTAETLRQNTEQELTLFADVLESVCALHALSDAVDQAAMDEFIQKGMVHQNTVLGPFGLTQKISPWLRSEVEGKKQNLPGAYQVVQQGPNETWVSAAIRPVYYPLTWQSRSNGLTVPIGFDFSSLGEDARDTIAQIEQTRRPALVPSPDSFSKTEHPAYWVFAPVIPQPTREGILYFPPDTVLGFSVAVLHPEIILHRVVSLAVPSPDLRLKLTVAPDAEPAETIQRSSRLWHYRSVLQAIGTQWIFECTLPLSTTGNRSTATLIIGLIITVLMTSLLLLMAGRTRKIEATVRARTEDLRIANTRLEETLHERARLEEEMTELAARERRRIGRDLHDSLGQKLTGAVFLSRSLLDYFSNNRNQESGVRAQESEAGIRHSTRLPRNMRGDTRHPQEIHAQTLNETLKDAVFQVRNMARGLDPVALNNESLCDVLAQLAEEMTGLYGVSCEIAECKEPAGLDRKTKEQTYLIAREAVNNAARHAQARRITIRLTSSGFGWHLRIEDDGNGLPETQAKEGLPCSVPEALLQGMGIRIMRHRAGLIGAVFSITSAPGQGTCVTVKSI